MPVERTPGPSPDLVGFLADLEREPFLYDFYEAMRRLECLYETHPRWGTSRLPAEEPIRLGQAPALTFAPSPISAFQRDADGPHRLTVRMFGLFGPNGPLPLHLTTYAYQRVVNARDGALVRFIDLFCHHRFLSYFYRAWAQAQPHVHYDRPEEDRFGRFVSALFGMSSDALLHRHAFPDDAARFYAGTLSRRVKNATGLEAILGDYFKVPAHIEQFVGHWIPLAPAERTSLGRHDAPLGGGATAGTRVWDVQHKIRVHLGPLTLSRYMEFLPPDRDRTPGQDPGPLRHLVDWIRIYLSFELKWDLCLTLMASEVPRLQLGRGQRLGWTTWLGSVRAALATPHVAIDPEALLSQGRSV